MKSVVLLLSALLIFASWVDAANPFPNADESKYLIYIKGGLKSENTGGILHSPKFENYAELLHPVK